MTTAHSDATSGSSGWSRTTQVVVFQESFHGLVRKIDFSPPSAGDRLECAIAAENVMLLAGDAETLAGCVLEDLTIAVDVGVETTDGALAGVVRSGRVHVEGMPSLTVHRGEFELFPRVPSDGRRLRYRLWLRDPSGAAWYLRGTKLVVNELGHGLAGRIWAETTTLYVVIVPVGAASQGPSPASRPGIPSYTGVVRVRMSDFVRQLASVRGEPGPSGGFRAVGRLATTFRSALSEIYLRDGSADTFAPGIDVAFEDVRR